MGKLTDKLFHHDKSTTSSETVSTVPAVVPVPPFEDLAPKETLNTSPSHPSLLQKFKDYIHHDNASTTTPLETPEIVGPAIAVPVIPVTVTSTPVVATPVIVAPVIPTPSSSETVPHHSTLDTLVEKVTHPHPPAGSFIHPFDRPLEVHTIAETHHLPEPLPTHTATHVPSAEESPVFSAVPILIVEETIEVAIVPETTIPGEVSVPSIEEIPHVHQAPIHSLEGTSEAHSIPATTSTTGVKRKLHQD